MAIIYVKQLKNKGQQRDVVRRVINPITKQEEMVVVQKAEHYVSRKMSLLDKNGQPYPWATYLYISAKLSNYDMTVEGIEGFDETIARITDIERRDEFKAIRKLCLEKLHGSEVEFERNKLQVEVEELKKQLAESAAVDKKTKPAKAQESK